MNDRLVRTGLLLPAGVAWIVALVATAAPAWAGAGAAVSAACALPLGILAVRRPTRGAALVAAAALVGAIVLVAVWVGEAQRHPGGIATGSATEVDVRVDGVGAVTGNDVRGSLAARQVVSGTVVAAGGRRLAIPVTLFATGLRRVDPGSVIRVTASLRPAASTDRAAYVGSIHDLERIVVRPPAGLQAAAGLRQGLLAVTARLPGDGGELLPGLSVGDTSRVRADLTQAMRNSSLTHLTAVSGANCAVVIVAVLWLAGLLRVPRAPRLLLAGAALGGFVVLVTPQPSVVRAALMAAIGLACLLRGGRSAAVPVLALTVIVLLIVDPWYAWTAGFVLSVAATAGLLLLAPPLADRLSRVLPPRLALVLAVPIAAQVACQPVLTLLQPGVPVFGVVANLLAEPAAPVATVLGLVACLLAPVLPPLATGIAALAWLPAAWIGIVARTTALLPQLGWPAGVAGALLAAILLVGGVLACFRAAPGAARAAGAVVVAVAVVAVTGATAGGVVVRLAGTPSDWVFAACDVGQGDGLVVNGGDGRYAVIDTGREPAPIAACLDRLGVHRIDLLILTHYDADHVGAARSIASRVRSAFVGPVDGVAATLLRRDLARAGATLTEVHRGESASLGRLRLDVLWPPSPLGDVEPGNAASVTVLVTGGGASVLTTGDLGEDAQNALLAAGPLPRVDLIKVAHHGSADQSPAFYAATGAALGVISVGADNDYGHPTARLLGILRATGITPVRTDQSGLVLVSWHQGRMRLWTERPVTRAVWTPAQ